MARRTLLILLMACFAVFNGLSALGAQPMAGCSSSASSAGLPHGAYFGVAALVAASLVPDNKRSQAVGRVMLGLTVATVIGVPLANWMGQAIGWRWGFAVVAVLALLTVALVWWLAPQDRAGAMREPAPRARRAGERAGVAHARDQRDRLWRLVLRLHLCRLDPARSDAVSAVDDPGGACGIRRSA
jgi:predicted MFS family arabinose efflux permease